MVSKVAIIGANGKVATKLVQKLAGLKSEFEPVAFIRNNSQGSKFDQLGVKYSTAIDLTNTNLASITETLKGFDAVVFSAGAGGKGLDLTFSVDLDGAVKVAEAVKANNIDRFILVSALKSEDRDFWWDSGLRSYFIAKKYADAVVQQLDINWTIIQPGHLKDEEETGKVTAPAKVDSIADTISDASKLDIPRGDVAQAIIESLRNRNTIKKLVPLVRGDIPIDEALKSSL